MRKYRTNYREIIYSSRICNDEELLSGRNNPTKKKKQMRYLTGQKNAILLTPICCIIHIFFWPDVVINKCIKTCGSKLFCITMDKTFILNEYWELITQTGESSD